MNSEASQASENPVACAAMARHIAAIRRVVVDHDYAYDSDLLLEQKLRYMAENCSMVLDVGQSSRNFFDLFERQKIETMDINPGIPPADIIDDICAPSRLEYGRYDGIVCLSVLEHVYDPFAAINEIHQLLQPGGYLHRFWKKSVEKRFGQKPARWLDRLGLRLFRRPTSELQVSGYYAWARK